MVDYGLKGKVAVVTGGGSQGPGIGNGRAISVLLAEAGAHVVVVDLHAEHMLDTEKLIRERGGDCITVAADVSRSDECARVVALAVARWGRLDVLVNNVGILGPTGTVVDVDLDAWDRCVQVNLTSMLLMSRHAIPHMREAGGGAIVNMSSAAGLLASYPHVAYSTTKGAITNLTRSMAASHGPDGVRVNAIAPGPVFTPMRTVEGLSDADRERRRTMNPLQTEGTGWDVGHAALFLVSDKARWITGVMLPVDAGVTATLPSSWTAGS